MYIDITTLLKKMTRLVRIRTRRHALSYLIIILLGTYILTLLARMRCSEFYSNLQDSMRVYLRYPDDTSCYNKEKHDEIKFIKKNAIYMISASCDSSLSVHHACVIESVMRTHNYETKVYVFFNKPVKECACSDALIKGLKGLPSLKFVTIQIDKFVKDTPFKGVFKGNFLKIGLRRQARVAEYLKLATLYKFGGTVIDLDIIMAKPVNYLGLNWAVRINESQLGSAAMALNKETRIGKSILTRSMELLKLQKDQVEVDAGLALTEAFRQVCYNRPVTQCSDFRIYEADVFYPFNKSSNHLMFEKGNLQAYTFGYYVWDRSEIRRNRASVYDQLMREYCPNLASFYDVL